MAIQHAIRDNKGNTKAVKLTALSAIRAFCFECTCWNYYEVEKCTAPLCPLYPFRNREATRGTQGRREVSQKSLEALKKARAKRQESTQEDR